LPRCRQILTNVALQSNRHVLHYYAQYMDDGQQNTTADGTDLHRTGDNELRRHKLRIREFVDRTTDIDTFLEVEAIVGSFSSAYHEAARQVQRLAGSRTWKSPLALCNAKLQAIKEDMPKQMSAGLKTTIAQLLNEHADLRGNFELAQGIQMGDADILRALTDPRFWAPGANKSF
jgi:hypothetical protein